MVGPFLTAGSMGMMRETLDSSPAPLPQDSLANRYGRAQSAGEHTQTARRRGRWLAVVGLILAVGVTAWFTFSATARNLAWKDVGFRIESPTQAEVTFQLTKDPDSTVACAVQVLNEQYAVVGFRTVMVGPAEDGQVQTASDETQYYDVSLRTDAEGVSGGVDECWIEEPTV